jgi:hypothetical protein
MGAMPPPGAPRPDRAAVDTFVKALIVAAAHQTPPDRITTAQSGRNRTRSDLLAPDIDTASLPATMPKGSTTWRVCCRFRRR